MMVGSERQRGRAAHGSLEDAVTGGVCLSPPSLPGSYLVVELTNRCSLACVHCSVSEAGHAHHAQSGYLDPQVFDGLLADLVQHNVRFDALILFWLGEPLLHPHFTRLYRQAVRAAVRHKTFGKIEVHSNGTHLTAARVAALLNDADVPQVIHLSLDAVRQQTYTAVKGLDRLARVDGNVAHLLQTRGKVRSRWPRVVLQYIVGSNNVDEAPEFRARWEQEARTAGLAVRSVAGHVPPGDDVVVFFRQLDCPTPAQQEHENAVFRRAMTQMGLSLPAQAARGETVEAVNLSPCSGFWKSPVVSWDGRLTVCTRDNTLEHGLGSLRDQSFTSMWWGEQQRRRRRQVAQGDYTGLDLCSTCFIPRSLNHTELSASEIAVSQAFDEGLEG